MAVQRQLAGIGQVDAGQDVDEGALAHTVPVKPAPTIAASMWIRRSIGSPHSPISEKASWRKRPPGIGPLCLGSPASSAARQPGQLGSNADPVGDDSQLTGRAQVAGDVKGCGAIAEHGPVAADARSQTLSCVKTSSLRTLPTFGR